MAYNPFRWYTKGSYRKKPLKSKSPLLLKIQNGDFEYSPYLKEAIDEEKNYQKKYDDFMKTSLQQDGLEKQTEAHQHELKRLLKEEFGKCLWDKCLEKQRGKGTTEDMYWWYKKQMGLTYTKSELQIRGISI